MQIDQAQHGAHRAFEVGAQVIRAHQVGVLAHGLGAVAGDTCRDITVDHTGGDPLYPGFFKQGAVIVADELGGRAQRKLSSLSSGSASLSLDFAATGGATMAAARRARARMMRSSSAKVS